MSDAAKWALLAAALVILIALVVSLPFFAYINSSVFSSAVTVIVSTAEDYFRAARGTINVFFSSWGRGALTGLLVYWFGKWAFTVVIKLSTWVYHFVFK